MSEIASYIMSEESVGQAINRAARLARRLMDRRLADLGLSSGHLPVLTALMEREPLSQKALVDHAGIEQPTMAATLGRMERDGIITRWPNPTDKRTLLYALSPPVREKAEAIRSAIDGINDTVGNSLTVEDLNNFRRILRTMAQSLGKALDE